MELVKVSNQITEVKNEIEEVKKPSYAIQPASKVQIPIARPKPKPNVLTEEIYIESLDKIIQRDFFPDLPKLRTQLEWLKAEQAGDIVKMREIHQRMKGDVRDTPATFDSATPASFTPRDPPTVSSNTNNASEDKTAPNLQLRLNTFQALHTSEDNASFDVILDKQESQKRQKYSYLLEQEQKTNQLLLTADDTDPRANKLIPWKYTAKNLLMYNADGATMTVAEEKQLNSIPVEINYDNTRLHQPLVPPIQKDKDKNNSKQYDLITDERAVLLQQRKAAKEQKVDLDEVRGLKSIVPDSPRVGGYGFVSMTPSPAPDASPFTTWGTIEGTPILLDTNTRGPVFKVPETPKREELAHKLVDQSTKAKKLKMTNKGFMSPRVAASPYTADMQLRASYQSPLAKRLATPTRATTPVPKSSPATPSPLSKPSSTDRIKI